MKSTRRLKALSSIALLALFSGIVPRDSLNLGENPAGGSIFDAGTASGESLDTDLMSAPPLERSLFITARDLSKALHRQPQEARTAADYHRVIDAYGLVARAGADERLAAAALADSADLMREMADVAGDYSLYQRAIENFRNIVSNYPQSNYVGYLLKSIAEIYEENLQDPDGAAAAYRNVAAYFPDSVLARESRAILARYDTEIQEHGREPDVRIEPGSAAIVVGGDWGARDGTAVVLNNIRNFSGPDYARVVIDLSDQAEFRQRRAGSGRLDIAISSVRVARSMVGRRFIIGDNRFLRRITVTQTDSNTGGVVVELDAPGLSGFSSFQLADPARLIIDLRSETETMQPEAARHSTGGGAVREAASESAPEEEAAGSRSSGEAGVLDLPDVDVSNLDQLVKGGAARPTTPPVQPLTGTGENAATAEGGQPAVGKEIKEDKGTSGQVHCIVIDPGHGGHDTGTIGEGGLKEKDLVLDVGRKLRDYIKKYYPEIEVVMTRDSDRFVALEERTAIANSRRADLFISIHANAAPARAASGVETYFLSPERASQEDMKAAARENETLVRDATAGAASLEDSLHTAVAAQSASSRVAQSRELASYIQSGLVRGVGSAAPRTAQNRGVKHADFVVLVGAAMPSVLAEISFVSNPRDEGLLTTDQFRARIAASLFAGLRAYLKKPHRGVLTIKAGPASKTVPASNPAGGTAVPPAKSQP